MAMEVSVEIVYTISRRKMSSEVVRYFVIYMWML